MDGYVQIGTKLDTKNFDAQIEEVEYELKQIEFELSKKKELKLDSRTIMEYEQKAEKLNNQLIDLRKKQADLNKTYLSKIQNSIENIGKSTGKTIKRLGKWALGIFAIESAYGFVRQAMSSITQYNEQLATDIEYIRYSLAISLEPLIKKIVEWIYTIMQYVNYISMQWFGINLFANASADGMNKATQSAKQLKKEMAGFDEMNVIGGNDTNKGNSLLPSTDLTQNQIETPDWLKKITKELEGLAKFAVEHPELLIGILGGMKLTGFIASIIGVSGGTAGLLGIATALLIINGITLSDIINNIKIIDKTIANIYDNQNKINQKESEINKQWKNFTGEEVMEHWNQLLAVSNGNIKNANKVSSEYFKNLDLGSEIIDKMTGTYYAMQKQLKENLNSLSNTSQKMDDVYEKTDKSTEKTKDYIEFLNLYKQELEKTNENLSEYAKKSVDAKNIVIQNNDEITKINSKIQILNDNLKNSANNFENVGTEASETKNKLSDAKGIYDSFKSKNVKLTVDAETSKAQSAFKNIFNGISGTVSNIFSSLGLNIKIPKLATGGIINMPGCGIPIGGAIGGEAGAEGVIPLTDSQAMETLGQAIGKYITINASITNTMNGRVISRELQKINANNDFATNR